ncbi:MAG: DEAD/DEAH box helicase [Thermodesulfovibrionales bacterium]
MTAIAVAIPEEDIAIIPAEGEDPSMSLVDFMRIFAPQLEKKIEDTFTPIYAPDSREDQKDFGSNVEPFPIQKEVVKALHAAYKYGKRAPFLVGEMGVGKTNMGIWTAEILKAKRTLVVCPPHLVPQWREEILNLYPHKKVAIIPDPKLRKLNISNMAALQAIHRQSNVDFVVISREAIKTDYPWKPCLYRKRLTGTYHCPSCGAEPDSDTILQMYKAKTICSACGSALFQYVRSARSAPSLAKYIQKKMPGFFNFTIFDEAHELKAGDSAQGAVLGKLGTKTRILPMTGTLMGGKSSDLFYLFYRTNAQRMKEERLEYSSETAFVERFGVLEKTYEEEDGDNSNSIGKKRNRKGLKERPGISPLFVGKFLVDNAVFVRLTDFAEHLPLYIEHPIGCALHPVAEAGYLRLLDYKIHIGRAENKAKVVSSAVQALLRYPDTHDEEIICDETKNGLLVPLIEVPKVDIPIGETEKEQKTLEIVKQAKKEGKKVLIFTTQTNKRDLQPRLTRLLEQVGLRSTVMTTSVATGKRKDWIASRTPNIDALICHPKLVATGFNLLEYPVIIFYDTGWSTFVLRQAARRSYRINQPREQIDVYYFFTQNTIQQDCLSLMATKNEVSLMVEGEIQEGGLSTMCDAGGSILGELAKVINGELKTENPLEVFSRLNKMNNAGKREERLTEDEAVIDLAVNIHKAVPKTADIVAPVKFNPVQVSLFG